MNLATSAEEGGIGMMTCGVQNIGNGRGNGGRLFAGRRETVESLNMETIAVQLVAITVATNQEYYCFHAPDLGTLRKIADAVRWQSSIGEIPVENGCDAESVQWSPRDQINRQINPDGSPVFPAHCGAW